MITLFRRYGYREYPTGADSSFSNGSVERAHRTIATSVRALLFGANLPVSFWSYAFHHVLRIQNSIPHRGQSASPLFLATNYKDNFSNLKTWGCRVWVRPPGVRSKRFQSEARRGIFLGYMPHTSRVILWYDEGTSKVKIATHAKFDEGFNDLPADTLPPNCQQLLRRNGTAIPIDKKEISSSDLEFFIYPFSEKENATISVLPNNADESFGFKLRDDELYGRTFVQDVANTKSSSAAKAYGDFKRSCWKLRGAFITHIDNEPVFSTAQAMERLRSLFEQWKEITAQGGDAAKFLFDITFAREENLQGKKLKRAINDFHFLTPGTTKHVKSKLPTAKEEEDPDMKEVDDGSKRFDIGFNVYKMFGGVHSNSLLEIN